MTNDQTPLPEALDRHIEVVRAFNRFYTRQIGLLLESLYDSDFSLTEVRILYELANRNAPTASDLTRHLGLDAGYLSRILKRFEKRGLLTRTASSRDARQAVLTLTDAGQAAFDPLNEASRRDVGAMLKPLAETDQEKLTRAMQTIQRLLGDASQPPVSYMLRPLQTGDIGWIVHRQGLLYAREYGWDETFEALVAEIAASFVKDFDPQWENAWIAEREDEIVGSVFVVKQSDEIAKLRLLYVEPATRGLGIGRRLVRECIRFARAKGYKTLTLWTNDVLTAARHIYEAEGFQLIAEESHHSFGKDLVGQNWDLAL